MKSILIIRLSTGVIFLLEGLQKFLFPHILGVARFQSIGIPFPEFTAPMVGSFEIICGILVLLGFATQFAVIPLLIIITTAIATTKIPILIESGFFKMAHEARTDYAMLLSLLFLLIAGAGKLSLDQAIFKEQTWPFTPKNTSNSAK